MNMLLRLLLACMAGLTLALAPGAASAAKTIDIDAARALPLGTTVTVKGTVTVASGTFSSSTFDQGFALQDKSGGIYVSLAENLGLELRDQAEVQGQLQDNFGVLTLVVSGPENVRQKGHGKKVTPAEVGTGDVGETTEGRLVAVEGAITRPVVNDLPFGWLIYVDDGSGELQVFVAASTGIDVSGLSQGQNLRVVGLSGQFATTHEIEPRIQADITVLP